MGVLYCHSFVSSLSSCAYRSDAYRLEMASSSEMFSSFEITFARSAQINGRMAVNFAFSILCRLPNFAHFDQFAESQCSVRVECDLVVQRFRLQTLDRIIFVQNVSETLTTTTKSLTGLTANTAYTVEVRAVCEDAESDWVTTTFTTLEEVPEIIAPVVTTTEATSVTHESAVLNGTITAGSEEITAQGFRYKTATASEWIEVSATGTTISATVNNLTAETSYVFKAFATTASGTVEGAEMTFTTIAAPIVVVEGEVTTTPATNIANTSATLNGALVSAGNSENYTIGFALATVADFTLADANVQNITATLTDNTFTATVNDLTEGQTYFYRAYITNQAGTAYGAVETFTLLSLTDALANQIAVSLYPNPVSDNATLEINGLNQDAKIVISDLQGRILSQDNINAGTTRYTINVSDMTSGVYYIRIITDNVVSTQKLIVE